VDLIKRSALLNISRVISTEYSTLKNDSDVSLPVSTPIPVLLPLFLPFLEKTPKQGAMLSRTTHLYFRDNFSKVLQFASGNKHVSSYTVD
jgi:hypothetical protein